MKRPAALLILSVMWLVVPCAWGVVAFTTLVSFTGTSGVYPGAYPYAGLALGSDGNFYGTTSSGGTNNHGTIFQLTPGGAFTSLLSFNGTNGAAPYAAPVQGADGNFYGTTFNGGVSNWGTIYRITTNGTFTNLFSFTGTNNPYLGANPGAALVPAGDGSFFGTADFGGASTNVVPIISGAGYGTIFQLTTNGTVVVPVFLGYTNGAYPSGGLVLGQDGNFYGTTLCGGNGISGSFPGYGTVFKMTPGGTFTNIYLFTGFGDGGFIYAGLVQGRNGNLYGAAFSGGQGYGTLFKVSTNGSFTLLHTFTYYESGSPYGGLTEGSDGNFLRNDLRRGCRLWHCVQTNSRWRFHESGFLQYCQWRPSRRGSDPRPRRQLLRHDLPGRRERLGNDFPAQCSHAPGVQSNNADGWRGHAHLERGGRSNLSIAILDQPGSSQLEQLWQTHRCARWHHDQNRFRCRQFPATVLPRRPFSVSPPFTSAASGTIPSQ